MANPVSPVHGTTAVEHAPQPQKAVQTPAKSSAFPNDTVTLSNAAKQTPTANKVTGDVDHDGDNH